MESKNKWKKGDYALAKRSYPRCFTTGKAYKVIKIDDFGAVHVEKDDKKIKNGWHYTMFIHIDGNSLSELEKEIYDLK